MKALFLAGGIGTRLKPITDNLPKPMIPIMGKPLLERNIENLRKHGITEIILSTCYKPYKIEKHFGNGKEINVIIDYLLEDIPLGTAGAIKNAERFFDSTFLVFNADILSDINISDLIKFHQKKDAIATIAVTKVNNPSNYGVIEYCENDYITSFKEKPKPGETSSDLINAGIYVFEPELLKEIPAGIAVSIEKDTYPSLLQKGFKLAVYNKCSYWMDLGTPQKYMQAHKDILNGKLILDDFDANCQYISKNAKINKNAKIYPPVYIGNNVEVEANATIGPDTVLFDNCYIGMNANVTGSIVWDSANVYGESMISDSIVMSNCVVECTKDDSTLIEELNSPLVV